MNLQAILSRLVEVARGIGAEKVFLSKFDVAATRIGLRDCDDPFIDRVYPVVGGLEVEEPLFYATDAVAPGWVVFVAGGSVNIKDLSEWVKKEES